MSVKICIIGAGSAVFSLSLIKDICLTPGLRGSTVTLMDVDPVRLEDAWLLCHRYAREAGIRLTIERTTDRRESMAGADFVINTALAAGHERLREGWSIAFRHGYRFGGSLHVVHDEAFWINHYQLRLMEEILQDALEVCPAAWYVLVANPVMAGITYLSRRYRGARLVGMCHGYGGVYRVAEMLGLEREGLAFEIPGVNHFVWLNRLEYRGQDAFPLLDRWIREESARYFETCDICDPLGPKAVDLYRRFGVFPIGDTGNPGGGSWGYWYHQDRATERAWKEDPSSWYERYFAWGRDNVARIGKAARDPSVPVMESFPGTVSDEPMIPLIEALACNVERRIIVNIPNDGGFVAGVPPDFEVEVPALVDGRGIRGLPTRRLPDPVLLFLSRDRIAPVEMELAAFQGGRKELLVELLLMDPWTRSGDQARALLEDILALPAHRQMREHYR